MLGCISLQAQHVVEFTLENAPSAVRQIMQRNAGAVFSEISKSYENRSSVLALSPDHATPEAIERIQALWNTSLYYCPKTEITARVLRSPNGWQVRNIPCFIDRGGSSEDRHQNLVIHFTPDGIISDLRIALPMHEYFRVIETNDMGTDRRRRQRILEFVENFRTAYNRKDIDFIQEVFGDDLAMNRNTQRNLGIKSKSAYIAGLKRLFMRNAYLNIRFDEMEVLQHDGNPNIYGVLLRQTLESSTWNDGGWLFLMMDFKDEENPVTWVQTWQSLDVPRNNVFGLDNFKINR